MANRLAPKRSNVASAVPTTVQLVDGEMAINTADRKLYVRVGAAIVDLFANLAALASPSFTGTPTAPTAAAGTDTTQLATTAFVQAARGAQINTITSTSYTLVLGDANRFLKFDNAAAQTVTIPPQASVAWADNTQIEFAQLGLGVVTLIPGSGVALRISNKLTLSSAGQFAVFGLKRLAADDWLAFGHLEPA